MAPKKSTMFKQKNPFDPKNPFLNENNGGDFFSVEMESEVDLGNKKRGTSSKKETDHLTLTLEQEAIRGRAQSILKGNVKMGGKIIDQNDPESIEHLKNEVVNTGELVLPDPGSRDSRHMAKKYQVDYQKKHHEEVRLRIRGMQDVIRSTLQEKDIEMIIKEFKHQVIKINKKEIILKAAKFGYEIYFNNADNRWWIVALKFIEPFDPKKMNYITYWVGTSFIGYGFPTLKEMIVKAREMLTGGRTGYIAWRDFVIKFDEANNRILANKEATSFPLKDYKKFVSWFQKNKIWIMVKREGMHDSEDLMLEMREKRRRGEPVNPMAGIQAKFLEPPRKANFLTAYPVADPNYKGREWYDPENKLYQIGFTFNE